MSWSFFTKEGVEKIGEFGVAGLTGGDADTLDGLDSSQYWKKSEIISADTVGGYDPSDFLHRDGTLAMQGALLLLPTDPTLDDHAARKRYVDNQVALKLNLTGGTLTGPLYLPAAGPTTGNQAVNRDYVDDQIEATVPMAGNVTLDGPLGVPLGANADHVVNRGYVDSTFFPADGGTIDGHIDQPLSPAIGTHLANRDYVDDGDQASRDYTDTQVALITAGASGTAIRSVTDPTYTALVTDNVILCDSTANAITITLPSVVPPGKMYTIKDNGGNAVTNNITVDTQGIELIDGAATFELDTPREWVTVIYYNGNWVVIG